MCSGPAHPFFTRILLSRNEPTVPRKQSMGVTMLAISLGFSSLNFRAFVANRRHCALVNFNCLVPPVPSAPHLLSEIYAIASCCCWLIHPATQSNINRNRSMENSLLDMQELSPRHSKATVTTRNLISNKLWNRFDFWDITWLGVKGLWRHRNSVRFSNTDIKESYGWRPVRESNPCYRRERAVSWTARRTGRSTLKDGDYAAYWRAVTYKIR